MFRMRYTYLIISTAIMASALAFYGIQVYRAYLRPIPVASSFEQYLTLNISPYVLLPQLNYREQNEPRYRGEVVDAVLSILKRHAFDENDSALVQHIEAASWVANGDPKMGLQAYGPWSDYGRVYNSDGKTLMDIYLHGYSDDGYLLIQNEECDKFIDECIKRGYFGHRSTMGSVFFKGDIKDSRIIDEDMSYSTVPLNIVDEGIRYDLSYVTVELIGDTGRGIIVPYVILGDESQGKRISFGTNIYSLGYVKEKGCYRRMDIALGN